jgi:hypothetical protein
VALTKAEGKGQFGCAVRVSSTQALPMVFAPRQPHGGKISVAERMRLFRSVYERRNPFGQQPMQPNTVGATLTQTFGQHTYVERNGCSRRENPPCSLWSRGSARFKTDSLFMKKQQRGRESPGVGKYYGNKQSSFHSKPLPPRPDPLLLQRFPIPQCNPQLDFANTTLKQVGKERNWLM